jgi:hypothetical protein
MGFLRSIFSRFESDKASLSEQSLFIPESKPESAVPESIHSSDLPDDLKGSIDDPKRFPFQRLIGHGVHEGSFTMCFLCTHRDTGKLRLGYWGFNIVKHTACRDRANCEPLKEAKAFCLESHGCIMDKQGVTNSDVL